MRRGKGRAEEASPDVPWWALAENGVPCEYPPVSSEWLA